MQEKQDRVNVNQSQLQADKFKETIRKVTYLVITLLAIVLFTGYRLGWFDSAEPLKNFALNMGWPGFILLSILVILNNIVAVIPGNLPGLAMFLAYGPIVGFVSSVTFIIIGSFICFIISRQYGDMFVQAFIPEQIYHKYIGMIDKKSNATKLALIGYWVPGIYDGAVTMILGLSSMSWQKYLGILAFSKPIPTFIYFAGATGFGNVLMNWLSTII
ncbi:VTT domain-containing protein [Aerococcaceae bacterium 50-4]